MKHDENFLYNNMNKTKIRKESKHIDILHYKNDDDDYDKFDISKSIQNETSFSCLDSNYYTFNLIYFFSCISLIFLMIILHILSEYAWKNRKENLFPGFFYLKTIQPYLFLTILAFVILTGLINVWNFGLVLLQRFSVPELSSSKFIIYLMTFIGLVSNSFLVIFGITLDSNPSKVKKIQLINVSFSISVYLLFIFSNIIYALLSWLVLEKLMQQNRRLEKNMRMVVRLKTYVLIMELILLCLYILVIISYNSHKLKKHEENYSENDTNCYNYLKFGFSIFPYFLFVLNAFLNLTYYSEVLKIQDHINIFVDKDFFINNDESLFLIK